MTGQAAPLDAMRRALVAALELPAADPRPDPHQACAGGWRTPLS